MSHLEIRVLIKCTLWCVAFAVLVWLGARALRRPVAWKLERYFAYEARLGRCEAEVKWHVETWPHAYYLWTVMSHGALVDFGATTSRGRALRAAARALRTAART